VIHTLTLRRNLISLAIFNAIFWKIGGGLLFLGHSVVSVTANDKPIWHTMGWPKNLAVTDTIMCTFFLFRVLYVDLLIYLSLCLPAVLGNKSKSKLESSSNSGQHQFVSCVVKGGSFADGELPFFSPLESWRDVAERIYSSAVVIGESCQPGRCSLRRSAMQICRARERSRGV